MVGDSLLDKAARLAAKSVLPPKTARARSEAFGDSPKPCSYQRAKHVTTLTIQNNRELPEQFHLPEQIPFPEQSPRNNNC